MFGKKKTIVIIAGENSRTKITEDKRGIFWVESNKPDSVRIQVLEDVRLK